jgi:multidrug efflux pump subunit AcrA (membrane-fusion protein)
MVTKYILPLIAIVGVIFAVAFVLAGNKPLPTTQPVAQPAQAPFTNYVAGAGIVEASTENINIGTPVAGVVTKLDHWIGDRVKAGDILFRIDSRDQEAELKVRKAALKSAQASVKAQEAAVAEAENEWQKAKDMTDIRAMSKEERDRRQFNAQQAEAKLVQAQADVVSDQAMIESTQTELQRRLILAPVDGTVMQCKIHVGEFAAAAAATDDSPLMMLGNTDVLNVRVDIDENDAWRLLTNKDAIAYVRGNRDLSTPLKFVRVEPMVVPKKSLTGDSSERVDTRVLQVLYSFDPRSIPNIYVGQQMDVFIEAPSAGK